MPHWAAATRTREAILRKRHRSLPYFLGIRNHVSYRVMIYNRKRAYTFLLYDSPRIVRKVFVLWRAGPVLHEAIYEIIARETRCQLLICRALITRWQPMIMRQCFPEYQREIFGAIRALSHKGELISPRRNDIACIVIYTRQLVISSISKSERQWKWVGLRLFCSPTARITCLFCSQTSRHKIR